MKLGVIRFLFIFLIISTCFPPVIALQKDRKNDHFGKFSNNPHVVLKKLLILGGLGLGIGLLCYCLFHKKNNQANNNIIIVEGENNDQIDDYKNNTVKQEEVYSSEDLFLLSEQLVDDWKQLLKLTY
jgi:hypothetical protein